MRPRRLSCALAVIGSVALACSVLPAQAQVPVRIGGSADMDACGATGQVVGLNPSGDNFLALRAGPGTRYRELTRLRLGANVAICEASRDGLWYGVVVLPDGLDCRVGDNLVRRRAYRGPCQSGWVSRRFVRMVAG